jgi:transcriptional regulator GlxA family with amidase domain
VSEPAQTHGFLLLPRFSLLALGGAVDALAAANGVLGRNAHQALTLSIDGRAVRADGGLLVAVDHALANGPALDALYVVSDLPLADAARDGHDRTLHPGLRERAAAGTRLGGIGTGAAVLAQAGLLNGHRATLQYSLVAQLALLHPQAVLSNKVYEIDRNRISCAGATASLDMMISWLGEQHGERVAQELLAHFGLERLRRSDERQRSPAAARVGVGSAKLVEAVALMEANLGEPLPTEDIARLVGVSRRQLERLFKQHMDALPSRWYADLRLDRARRLLQQTSQSILQIGLACGFSSGSHFSNAYRARFERTPRDERSQRAAAWRRQQEDISP